MSSFFLELPPQSSIDPISYNDKVLLMGSCFVEHMGNMLNYHKFQALNNPFGIIFHPFPIVDLLERIIRNESFTEKDLFEHHDFWQSFQLHSSLSSDNPSELLEKLNTTLDHTHQFLKESKYLMITLGTAWGYQHESSENIVANCHRVSQQEFDKKLTSAQEIEAKLREVIQKLLFFNPFLNIVFTVSPVRHIRDGIVENNRSKSHLIAAIHNLTKTYDRLTYYPAYELVIDCLRDYRFYTADLVHPNDQAVMYIWKHFSETYLHQEETQSIIKITDEIQRGLAHRPMRPESEAYQKFKASLMKKMELLTHRYPFMNF